MDVTHIHERIAAAVNGAELSGNTLRVTATPYMPLMPEPPHFYPHSWRINYDKTFSRTRQQQNEFTSTWHLVLAIGDDESAHYEATRLAGSGEGTIREVILDARGGPGEEALGGVVDDILLRAASGPNSVDVGDLHLLVVEFSLFVIGH